MHSDVKGRMLVLTLGKSFHLQNHSHEGLCHKLDSNKNLLWKIALDNANGQDNVHSFNYNIFASRFGVKQYIYIVFYGDVFIVQVAKFYI